MKIIIGILVSIILFADNVVLLATFEKNLQTIFIEINNKFLTFR